ncbi:DEAD/DEAH box helicase family protein [Salmonella enterica subsp. enterica]|nr:DEAD/DEAH box helicase family protein [Salmonella enterica subsp. enterica]
MSILTQMETGRAKPGVYTRLMWRTASELRAFKFVLVVPTPAIKEGARTLSPAIQTAFFTVLRKYAIKLCTINAGDFEVKSGRKIFRPSLLSFTDASRRDSHTIQALLINAQMLNSASMTRDDMIKRYWVG